MHACIHLALPVMACLSLICLPAWACTPARGAQMEAGMLICRVGAPIYFANQQYIKDKLRQYKQHMADATPPDGQPLRYLVLDLTPVQHMDSSGVTLIEDMCRELHGQGVTLVVCDLSVSVAETFERAGTTDVLGREHVFVHVQDAVNHCRLGLAGA